MEFASFERLGDDTLMPLAEKTVSQELLEMPIPFAQRVHHLVPYAQPDYRNLKLADIDHAIGAPPQWSYRWLSAEGFSFDDIQQEADDAVYLLALLEEEWQWQQTFDALDEEITDYTAAHFLARGRIWIVRTLADLSIYPTYQRMGRNRYRFVYPKEVVKQLRHIMLASPLADGQVTIDEIAAESGVAKKTVDRIFKKEGITGDTRRSHKSGLRVRHFEPEVAQLVIGKFEHYPPMGDWMTISRIAKLLGKRKGWVVSRVDEYKHLSEQRISDEGNILTAYPPSVFESLKKLSDEADAIPYATETDLSIDGLATAVGHDRRWVQRHLPLITTKPRERRNQVNNRPGMYYDIAAVDELVVLDGITPYATEHDYTAVGLAEQVGHSRPWVIDRLGQIATKGRIMLVPAINVPYLHYNESAIEELLALPIRPQANKGKN